MKLHDIMTRNVHTISPDVPLADAAERMRALDVGALPVSAGDRVLGILTDRDIVVRSVARGEDPRHTRAGDVMTAEVVWLYEDQDLDEAARLMEVKSVRRLLVMTREMRLSGIVALGDLVQSGAGRYLVAEVLEKVCEAKPQHAPH